MGQAARAIIIKDDQLLLMHRSKHGSEYFTLVGGGLQAGESPEQAVVREVKEETGLDVTKSRLVFVEEHAELYNSQYIFLCEVAPHGELAVAPNAEEGQMNRLGMNIHTPVWAAIGTLERMQFRTPDLHKALIDALKKGFQDQPVRLGQ